MRPAAPCARCLSVPSLRREAVQPLPRGVLAPLARDGTGPCCQDCASADTLQRFGLAPGFEAARIAVANDRQEQYRLPGAPMGLVAIGLVRPSKPGDFERQIAWLNAHGWFGEREPDDG